MIAVPTVDALAYNLYGSDKVICPLMDARRNQVYTGLYEFVRESLGGYEMKCLVEQCAVDIQEIAQKVNAIGREVIFLGDGVDVYSQVLADIMQVPYSFAPACCNRQRAACVATLGEVMYEKGLLQTAAEHAPDYLRLSQAEREREEAQKKA